MSVNIPRQNRYTLPFSRPLFRLNLGLFFVFDTLDEQFVTNQMSMFTFTTKLQHFGDKRLTTFLNRSRQLFCDVKGGVFQITLQSYLSEVLFILSANKLSYDRCNFANLALSYTMRDIYFKVLLRVLNFED